MDSSLKNEFNKLKSENIISEEIYKKILKYYEEKEIYELGAFPTLQTSANEQKPEKTEKLEVKVQSVKKIETEVEAKAETKKSTPITESKKMNFTILLSVISAFLIGSGIISLIAYNWNAISRLSKSIAAFFICMLPPVIYAGLAKIRKKQFEQKSKEFFAVLWDLLFGGSIAFISQTYRMASNPVAFFIIWLVISIGITYSLKSYFAYYFSLFLVFVYSIYAQQFAYSTAVAFYPAMFLLFFFTKEKKNLLYLWVIELIALLSVVLEKKLPGLWIISYVSADILLLAYAKKKNDNILRTIGLVLAALLTILLSIPDLWERVGFHYWRSNAKYRLSGSFVDYIVTIGLYVLSFIAVIPPVIKNIKKQTFDACYENMIQFIFLITVGISYICCSINVGFYVYVNRIFLCIYYCLFILTLHTNFKKYAFLFFVPFFYAVSLSGINYPSLFLISFLAACGITVENTKTDSTERKISFYLPFCFLIAEKIYFLIEGNVFLLKTVNSECYILDTIISLTFTGLFLTYSIANAVKNRKSDAAGSCVFEIINSYFAFACLVLCSIVFEFAPEHFTNVFNICVVCLVLYNSLMFILFKTVNCKLSGILFIINFFSTTNAFSSPIFGFTFVILLLFALNFYKKIKFAYEAGISLFLIIGYIISKQVLFYSNSYNPFGTVTDAILFITLLICIFTIPYTYLFLQNKLKNWISVIVTVIASVFMIFGYQFKIFSPENLIQVICILFITLYSLEFTIFNKKESLIPLFSALAICVYQICEMENYFNNILLFSFILFASYYFIKALSKSEYLKEKLYPVLYGIFVFALFIINESRICICNTEGDLFYEASTIVNFCAVCIPLLLIPVYKMIKNRDVLSVSGLCINLISVIFMLLWNCSVSFSFEKYFQLINVAVIITCFIDTFIFKNKMCFILLPVALIKNISVCFIWSEFDIVTVMALGIFALLIYSKVLVNESKLMNSFSIFAFSVFLICSLSISFSYSEIVKNPSVMFYVSFIMIFASLFVVPCLFMIKNKLRMNYGIPAFLVLVLTNFFIVKLASPKNLDLQNISNVFVIIDFIIIFVFGIYGMIQAFEKKSIKAANFYLLFLFISFIVRVFMISDSGLVERGLICIACGICILITNLFLSAKFKQIAEKK